MGIRLTSWASMCSAVLFGLGTLPVTSYALDACVCETCAGDPAFVQRDQRAPATVVELRRTRVEQAEAAGQSEPQNLIILRGNEPAVRRVR